MNTLNNQQINPGNRVDFSRIRRFAKGGVPKYLNTPGPLTYNWQAFKDMWSQNPNAGTATSTSIPWNRSWTSSQYPSVLNLELSKHYTDFTNYILNNLSNSDVREYLKLLDTHARRTGDKQGLLFTDSSLSVLRDGWNTTYNNLRNDNKFGYFHLTPELQTTSTSVTPTLPMTPSSIEESTSDSASVLELTGLYTPVEYLPEYRPGIWTDGLHLAGIYVNNMLGAKRNYDLESKKRVPLEQASEQNYKVTDGYTERSLNNQALEESRYKNNLIAQNTSDLDQAHAMHTNFEDVVGTKTLMQNAAILARDYNTSMKEALRVADINSNNRTTVANNNQANLTAAYNARLAAKLKLNATRTAETSSLLLNLDASLNKFTAAEKQNRAAHNQAVNNYMYNKEASGFLSDYNDVLENGHLQHDYNGLMDHLLAGNDTSISTEHLNALRDNRNDFSKTKAILELYAENNPEIAIFLRQVEDAQNQAEKDYVKNILNLRQLKAYVDLFQKLNMGSYPGLHRDYLTTNWTTLFPTMHKKGGKVEDRFYKYLEYNRKILKDLDDRNKHAQTQVHKKLLRDLDALDRETLLLLRSIFK